MTRAWLSVCLLATLSCGSPPSGDDAGARDGAISGLDAGRDAAPGDGNVRDAMSGDAGPPIDAGPEPTTIIRPEPGEVTLIQMRLPGIVRLGEAAILVGPDGTIVLMDVGNSSHDDEVRALVRALNTDYITPARGFPRARGALEVEWIVLSHIHSDHLGGFLDLLTGTDPVTVTESVVHRGFVDLGSGITESDYAEVCGMLRGSLASLDLPLCTAASTAPCDSGSFTSAYPATDCPGLFLGDLSDALDDRAGAPSFLPLGGGARMVLVAADTFVSDGSTATQMAPFGTSDNNEENARSIVAVIEHGGFRYHWGGDLTGSGAAGEPDVEGHLISVAGDRFYGSLGMDVVHAHHHMRRTSSNVAFVDATAPSDGRSRNVIGGINGGHIGSPNAEVLARFGDSGRLGEGRIWITMSAAAGDSHPALIDADADVTLQTLGAGSGYRVQASRAAPLSRTFRSLR